MSKELWLFKAHPKILKDCLAVIIWYFSIKLNLIIAKMAENAAPSQVRAGRVDLHDVRGEIGAEMRRGRVQPPVRQNPSASSSSCPGVRIVTATAVPSTRISSGSSTASRSASVSPPGSRVTVARDVP